VKYGNCLFGAIVLLYTERSNNPKFIVRVRPQTYVPHFMVRSNSGLHHYKLNKDVLPFPLCYLIFAGEFQTLDLNKEELFYKR
jgi:hypothetical protein